MIKTMWDLSSRSMDIKPDGSNRTTVKPAWYFYNRPFYDFALYHIFFQITLFFLASLLETSLCAHDIHSDPPSSQYTDILKQTTTPNPLTSLFQRGLTVNNHLPNIYIVAAVTGHYSHSSWPPPSHPAPVFQHPAQYDPPSPQQAVAHSGQKGQGHTFPQASLR